MTTALLTAENYKQGMLVDDELVGGITDDPEKAGAFVAFVIRSSTGEHIVYRSFDRLEDALEQMNRVRRPWIYEATVGCGESGCGNNKDGGCKINGCGKKRRELAAAAEESEGGGCCGGGGHGHGHGHGAGGCCGGGHKEPESESISSTQSR